MKRMTRRVSNLRHLLKRIHVLSSFEIDWSQLLQPLDDALCETISMKTVTNIR